MGKLEFNSNDHHSLGVELEFGLVDRTGALSSSIEQILTEIPEESLISFKPELMQCCIEINTDVCHSVAQAEADLRGKIQRVEQILDPLDLRLWWGATHPFSHWGEQRVTPNDRYLGLVDLLQDMAKRLCTFGLHVHVGVDSGDKAVMICDRILQHLPTLLAISCSSPFWESRDTGLQSYRSKIMEGLPTAGLAPLMRNWSEYTWLINHMIETGFINTIREIWWDIRPHHNFGTVEVRVCDMPGNLDDVMALTALIQSLVKALSDQIDNGTYQHDCHPMMVRQNMWRAARFGKRAELVNSYTYEVQTIPQIIDFLVERLTPPAESLGCLEHLLEARRVASEPSWSDRQLTILAETGDPHAIVDQLTSNSRISQLS